MTVGSMALQTKLYTLPIQEPSYEGVLLTPLLFVPFADEGEALLKPLRESMSPNTSPNFMQYIAHFMLRHTCNMKQIR